MILVCSSTDNYFPKIRPFLQSVNRHFPGDIYLICVECMPPDGYLDDLPKVQALTITHDQNDGAPGESNSIQHGSFLRVLPTLPDNELIIYSDGDIVMQRPFTKFELQWFDIWGNDEIGASWNSGPNEKLIDEARRLHPKVSEELLIDLWGESVTYEPCFNIGVTIARAQTWRRLYSAYMQDWLKACDTFRHGARQQWLVCYEMAVLGLPRLVLPFSLHTHAHYGLPFGIWLTNNTAWYGHEPIAFRHRF